MGASRNASAVRRAFARQAPTLSAPGSPFADAQVMEWVVAGLPLDERSEVLDVGGGTGLLARALAPKVRRATVVDVTPEMLETGRRECAAAGVDNVAFAAGDAADLPFPGESFDLVACRFALHHVPDPRRALAEMARVCRPGGRLLVVDLVAADPALARSYNRLERLRDPSHAVALTEEALAGALASAGVSSVAVDRRDQPRDLERWLSQAGTPAERAEAIRAALRAELAGGPPTGMRPTMREGRLELAHRFVRLVAERPAVRPPAGRPRTA